MITLLTYLIPLAMAATVVALVMGLFQMARGSPDPHRSNRLMQYRILFQGAAILMFVLLLMLLKG
ncbi:twin transmembrane helix small protein [Rhodovarius lipocyclicus]|jgi:hypothetical protein|uniref:twin transmembrane helix small protein n=1 Tax=Rhodovarius lipocyclicus TaxID=268410 RepID=UPI0013582686|nr:twin transmembrane helix small protein [Rhodovarius lipocyclicus]